MRAVAAGVAGVLLLGLGAGGFLVATGDEPEPAEKPKAAAPVLAPTATLNAIPRLGPVTKIKRIPPPPPNPLAGRPWGVYLGPGDQVSAPYNNSRGETRALLAKIAERPRARWFGSWIADGAIEGNVRDYIAQSQRGDKSALVQMAVFRMHPWYKQSCQRAPSPAEQVSYRVWIDNFARGVGSTPAAIILQPDGPFLQCVPNFRLSTSQIAYAARRLGALPNASVYLDAGSANWPSGAGGAEAAVEFLIPSGVEHLRGIALNSTHYSSTEAEVARGAEIVQILADRGMPDKHVVVNTPSNGNPFVFGDYTGPDPDNAFVCRSANQPGTCVTLGIPPTADVANPKWGLPAETRDLAKKYVDAYLWFGRPWLHRQADPFVMERALQLARSTPY